MTLAARPRPPRSSRRAPAIAALAWALLGCGGPAPPAPEAESSSAIPASEAEYNSAIPASEAEYNSAIPGGSSGASAPGLPATIDPGARYLIYLHGRIVEGDDPRPVHPRFGVYDYPAVVDAFAAAGFEVVSEHRAEGSDMDAFAARVVAQARALLAAGVPPERLAVVGFSKGGGIAIRASVLLADERVPFVFLGACGGIRGENAPVVHGRILSVFEASDEIGPSCRPLLDRAIGPVPPREVEISTGEHHGAFFRPRREWLDPVVAFLQNPS